MSTCPACGKTSDQQFYRQDPEPVNSTLLMPTHHRAINFPKATINLALCLDCGFIWNSEFDSLNQEYSTQCEESQGFSKTFREWHESLSVRLVKRFSLRGKTVLEIGCGKGDFLAHLCVLGDNRGIGYDPAYIAERQPESVYRLMQVHQEFWSHSRGVHGADFIVCRHTLEHIPDVLHFVSSIRAAIDEAHSTLVFFEVPDMQRILKEVAFQDVYYEHCSYFTRDSLVGLFARCGFDVFDCWYDFHDQYLCLIARPGISSAQVQIQTGPLAHEAREFSEAAEILRHQWQKKLSDWSNTERQIVLWGGGSKAVTFLNRIDTSRCVQRVIDVNPHKHGAFIPGSGQPVLGPEALLQCPADVVIIMNPVYREEISQHLAIMGQSPELLTLA